MLYARKLPKPLHNLKIGLQIILRPDPARQSHPYQKREGY
jgi:hypothetical protein